MRGKKVSWLNIRQTTCWIDGLLLIFWHESRLQSYPLFTILYSCMINLSLKYLTSFFIFFVLYFRQSWLEKKRWVQFWFQPLNSATCINILSVKWQLFIQDCTISTLSQGKMKQLILPLTITDKRQKLRHNLKPRVVEKVALLSHSLRGPAGIENFNEHKLQRSYQGSSQRNSLGRPIFFESCSLTTQILALTGIFPWKSQGPARNKNRFTHQNSMVRLYKPWRWKCKGAYECAGVWDMSAIHPGRVNSISEHSVLSPLDRNKRKSLFPHVIIVNGAAAGCTATWQCRLEFHLSGFDALDNFFSSKTVYEPENYMI